MNTQPYNVCLSGPKRVTNDWQQEAEQWAALNRGVGGNSEFNPLTIKTLYVTGIILNACKRVRCWILTNLSRPLFIQATLCFLQQSSFLVVA
jgi:hypothetical protein